MDFLVTNGVKRGIAIQLTSHVESWLDETYIS
jgi:hypothetical protein